MSNLGRERSASSPSSPSRPSSASRGFRGTQSFSAFKPIRLRSDSRSSQVSIVEPHELINQSRESKQHDTYVELQTSFKLVNVVTRYEENTEKINTNKEKLHKIIDIIYNFNYNSISCLTEECQEKLGKIIKSMSIFNFDGKNNIFKKHCENGFKNLTDTNLILYFIAKYDTYLNIIINLLNTLKIIKISNDPDTQNIKLCKESISKAVLQYLLLIINFFNSNSYIETACEVVKNKNTWGELDSKYFNAFKTEIKKESDSTLYMLMCFRKSIFDDKGKSLDDKSSKQIDFIIPVDKQFTNIWEKDKQNIKFEYGKLQNYSKYFNLLITGFGPSAAGKTFLIKNLLSNLRDYGNKKVPGKIISEFTISIDGEIFRENSMIYCFVLMLSHLQGLLGFKNADKSAADKSVPDRVIIGSTGFGKAFTKLLQNPESATIAYRIGKEEGKKVGSKRLSLLNTSDLKSNFKKFLKNNDGNKPNSQIFGGNFNIYLPDTLSDKFEIENYNFLNSNGKFVIYMLIFQCKEGCKFCKGTSESGERRGLESGKKYSPDSYNKSMKNGRIALENNEKGLLRLLIHNSGGEKDEAGNDKQKPDRMTNDNHNEIIKAKYLKDTKTLIYASIIYRDNINFNVTGYVYPEIKNFNDELPKIINKYKPYDSKEREKMEKAILAMEWKNTALDKLNEIENTKPKQSSDWGIVQADFISTKQEKFIKYMKDHIKQINDNDVKQILGKIPKFVPLDSNNPPDTKNPPYTNNSFNILDPKHSEYQRYLDYRTKITKIMKEDENIEKFRKFLESSTSKQGGGYDSHKTNNSHIEQNKKNYSVQPEKKNQLRESSSSVTKKKKYVLSQKYRTKKR